MPVPENGLIVRYSASDRVKLSYHVDGFVQFSGENPQTIISGRDPVTKEPKGMGYESYPLATPITSGPSVGMTIWGLDEYLDVGHSKKNEHVLVFRQDKMNCVDHPSVCTGYTVGIFVYNESSDLSNVVTKNRFKRRNYSIPGSPYTEFVAYLPLANKSVFLGVIVQRVRVNFPTRSGFILGAPVDRKSHHGSTGVVMQACYPNFTRMLPVDSLDYTPADPNTPT